MVSTGIPRLTFELIFRFFWKLIRGKIRCWEKLLAYLLVFL